MSRTREAIVPFLAHVVADVGLLAGVAYGFAVLDPQDAAASGAVADRIWDLLLRLVTVTYIVLLVVGVRAYQRGVRGRLGVGILAAAWGYYVVATTLVGWVLGDAILKFKQQEGVWEGLGNGASSFLPVGWALTAVLTSVWGGLIVHRADTASGQPPLD